MKKNKLILLQLCVAIVLICTSVYATVSASIGVTASKTSVERGDDIQVVLSLDDVESNEKIQSVEGYINYDENVIEPITVNSIEKSEDNTVTIGNETLTVEDLTNSNANTVPASNAYVAFNGNPSSDNDAKIIIDFKDGITSDVNMLTINFKVKTDATVGEIEKAISYSDFILTNSGDSSSKVTKDIKINIKTPTTAVNNTNANTAINNTVNNTAGNNKTNNVTNNTVHNKTNNVTNNKTNNKTNNIINNKTNNKINNKTNNTNDGTVAGTKLPATGVKVIVVPVIMLLILAYVCYNRYMKYKDI